VKRGPRNWPVVRRGNGAARVAVWLVLAAQVAICGHGLWHHHDECAGETHGCAVCAVVHEPWVPTAGAAPVVFGGAAGWQGVCLPDEVVAALFEGPVTIRGPPTGVA
jgi:hypothetical protein